MSARFLVTGAGGQLGRALALEVAFASAAGHPGVRRVEKLLGVLDGIADETNDPTVRALRLSTSGFAMYQISEFRECLEGHR